MSESWRRKRYYRPRILLPYDSLASTELDDGLYFLSGPQLLVLRSLLGYAHRRITWVSQYNEADYLTPTVEEWDIVQAFVDDLEDTLMTSCCEDLVAALGAIDTTLQDNGTQLAAIVAALTAQGVTLSTMSDTLGDIEAHLPDIVAPLECLCAKQETILLNVTVSPDWVNYPGAEDAFDWSTTNPVTTVGAQVDQEACELAQAWYQAGFEWMTEFVLPALRFGFDKLIPAAAAAISVWTGGVALPAAIGVYALAELIQELLELGYDAAEANLENWLFTHKEDIVCLLYTGLKDGGTSADLWDVVQTDLIDPAPDLSAGDKFMCNVVMKYWGLGAATVAKAQASPWYTSIQTPDFCDACAEDPPVGSDWVAMPVTEEDGFIPIDHPVGAYWQNSCWLQNIASGFTVVGMLVEVTEKIGSCDYKWMDGVASGCGGDVSFTGNTSSQMPAAGWYYVYANYTHNHAEVVATLAPGASMDAVGNARAGPQAMSQCFQMGWNCTGSAELQVRYIVYSGTTEPPFGY